MLFPLFVSIEMYEKYEKLVHQLSVCALYDIETRQQNVGLIVNFLISRQILRWSSCFFLLLRQLLIAYFFKLLDIYSGNDWLIVNFEILRRVDVSIETFW